MVIANIKKSIIKMKEAIKVCRSYFPTFHLQSSS